MRLLLGIFFHGALLIFLFVSGCGEKAASVSKLQPIDLGILQSKAVAGDSRAQAQLGQLYAKGEGVTNSYVEAAKWFRLSAAQTNADGMLGLGELYEAGQAVPQDLNQAVKLYRQAAELGNADAQYTLAFMYEAGHGVRQSHVEAAKWYQRAAEQGQVLAQYDLGQRYNLGVGVAADRVEALKWLILAAANGQPDAANLRNKVRKQLSSAEVAEAQHRAADFKPNKIVSQ